MRELSLSRAMALSRLANKPTLLSSTTRRSSRAIMSLADVLPPVAAAGASQLADAYSQAITTAPLPTAALTASTLALAGDYVAQSSSQSATFDTRRAAAFGIFGALYTGLFQYNLFQFLIVNLDGTHLEQLVETAGLASVLPDTTLFGAVERTLINQLLIIPSLYYPFFFLVTGLAYRETLDQIKERAQSVYLPLLKRNVAFWVPVQFIQFAYVDPDLQLPYVCVAGLIWNIILSVVASSTPTASPAPAKVASGVVASTGGPIGRVVPTGQEATADKVVSGSRKND